MNAAAAVEIDWEWLHFSGLSTLQLYRMLGLRLEVFGLEQNCPYRDVDGLDIEAWHLLGWHRDGRGGEDVLAAYLRALPPGAPYPELTVGRIVTQQQYRGSGLGHRLVQEGLSCIETRWGAVTVKMSAQAHLQDYYRQHGFQTCSEPYLEDGIPHVAMQRLPQ